VCFTERLAHPALTPPAGKRQDTNKNNEVNAIVLDARSATSLSDLTWLYEAAKKHSESAAFRKPGGRVVIMRSSGQHQQEPEAVAVNEAIVGFGKSLAKENGPRGATVNLVCDATTRQQHGADEKDDPCSAPLTWLLSHESSYVTGQELTVDGPPSQRVSHDNKEGAVLITGAAGAIGKATADYFCNSNNNESAKHARPIEPPNLLLVDHPSTQGALELLAQHLTESSADLQPPDVHVLPLDVTHPDAGATLAQEGSRYGGLERVIHAAGITRDKTLRNMDYESSWSPVLQVNLQAVMDIDKTLLSTPGSLLGGADSSSTGASFVYFSSTSGIAGNAGQSNYAASKAGLLGYAQAMSSANPQHHFRVVSPGFIATDMTAKMPFLVRTVASRLNALGQAGQPMDVAATVAFLSSREAAGLAPGSNLRVCGLFMGGR
jgi:3-oxoacyl-[acyl-carrier protein] reductase